MNKKTEITLLGCITPHTPNCGGGKPHYKNVTIKFKIK